MHTFFSVINRMKYINRWGLMRNIEKENLQQHSHETAVLAHALATIANERFDAGINADRAAVLALYHDASEIVTGDLPTPIKYGTPELRNSYAKKEEHAKNILINRLPDYLKPVYTDILDSESAPEWPYVKTADTLSAYIKCVTEIKAGNTEFSAAEKNIYKKLEKNPLPALHVFMEEFLPAYGRTLDES
ncbi:MAG: 5'-deoxynucleotidase [Clostridia bacterium]|nr:5'-deoxynucleotidase [Clostridia bacterium]